MTSTDTSLKFKNALAALWATGVYDTVGLPGVVVCGDQSSGKSSALEALSSLQFPVDDGMCTRCVTIVEMGHGDVFKISATIKPYSKRNQQDRKKLSSWRVEVSDITQLGAVILAACEAMGSKETKGFLRDTLVVKMMAPIIPLFTFIDIPGLIQSARDGQPESDIAYIRDLVKGYMADESKLILTVVAASNDIELQGVLHLAKEIDPKGKRTIGVITKPDACEDRPAVQKGALELLKNKGNSKYQWRLGWHLLKNPSYSQKNMTKEQRDTSEAAYLSKHPWDVVPSKFKGAQCLSDRLEVYIYNKFISALPIIKNDIQTKIVEVEANLRPFARNTMTLASARTALQKLTAKIEHDVTEELSDLDWGTEDSFTCQLEDAAADLFLIMDTRGHVYELDQDTLLNAPRDPTARLQTKWSTMKPQPLQHLQQLAYKIVHEANADVGQVSEAMYHQLFRQQVGHWEYLLVQYIDKVRSIVHKRVLEIIAHLVPDEISDAFDNVVMQPYIYAFGEKLANSADKLLEPGTIRKRQTTELAAKAWKVQHRDVELQRLQKVFDIGKTAGQETPQRDYESVLQRLRESEVEPESFPARQAIAIMQQLYLDRVEYLKRSWDEKSMLRKALESFANFSQDVMGKVVDVDLSLIYNVAGDEDMNKINKLKETLALHKKSLVLLEEL